MRRVCFLACALSAAGASPVLAQEEPPPREAWAARYDGPSGAYDSIRAVAADAAGNVYVTGSSDVHGFQGDFVTLKHDPTGKRLWLTRYDGPAGEVDAPVAMALDGSGNVYVAGESRRVEEAFGIDVAVVKYDARGNELWVARHDGPSHVHDLPAAMAVDAAGNAYVATTESGGKEANAIVTFKCDAAGNELWVARSDFTYDDAARSLALDGAGGVYVLAQAGSSYVLLHYDGLGNEIWRSTGEGMVPYSPGSLAVGGDGRAHIAVMVYREEHELRTLKFDDDGSIQWMAPKLVGSGRPGSLAVDAAGNVCVLGWRYDDAPRLLLLKYDPQGTFLWEAGGDVIDEISSWMVLDAGGNIHVACSTGAFRHVVFKYGPGGSLLWTARAVAAGSVDDGPRGMALDALGNVHVAGQVTTPESGPDYVLRKHDTAGNELWEARYGGAGHGDDIAASVILEGGGVVVSGISLAAGRGWEFATVKYDAQGGMAWSSRYDPPGDQAVPGGIAADAAGGVFVAGSYFDQDNIEDFVLVKYDASGRQLWAAVEEAIPPGHSEAAGVAVDPEGNAYLAATNSGFVLLKYAPEGRLAWRRTYLPAGEFRFAGAAALTLDEGGIYITGTAGPPAVNTFCVTLKYDANGDLLWESRHDSNPGPDRGVAIVTGPGGVYVAVSSNPDSTRAIANFVKYDPDGNRVWAAAYGQRGAVQFGPAGIAVDAAGNLFATGVMTVAGTTGTTYATLKFDPDGILDWSSFSFGARFESPRGIALDAQGNVYVTGNSHDEESRSDVATFKYSPEGAELWSARWSGERSGENFARDIAVDQGGNIYIAGGGSGPRGGRDFVTLKYAQGESQPRFLRGDCDGDGLVAGSVTDAVFLLNFNFLGGTRPGCLAACDANGDGAVIGSVTDAVYLLSFSFLAGNPPPPPFPGCGPGTAGDEALGCRTPAPGCGG